MTLSPDSYRVANRPFQLWNDALMELADLRVFLRVLDSGSLSAAGRGLDLPKSSISRALSRLEASAGAVLIDRSGRRVKLTEAGAALRPHARSLVAASQEAQAAVDGACGLLRGTLRVNAPFALSSVLLWPVFADLLIRYPDLDLVIEVDNRHIDVAVEEVDVTLRLGPMPDSELVARHLADMELWTCASPSYLAVHGTPEAPNDLTAHRLISRVDRYSRWRYVSPQGGPIDIEVAPRTVVPDVTILLPLLAAGCGIGRLPHVLAIPAIAEGSLKQVLPTYGAQRLPLHAVYTNRKSLPAKAKIFIDAVAAHLGK